MKRLQKRWPLLAGILIVVLQACSPRVEPPRGGSPSSATEQTVGALLWFQSSGEARALYYQAYQLARLRLTEQLRVQRALPPAVVVDIDETILDNSPHQAKLVRTNQEFPAFWDEWIDRSEARPLPGAAEFLQFADSNNVAVFYVSNRDQRMLEVTVRNLQRFGFPQLTAERFLLRTKGSSKAERRQRIAERYDIVLLVGDNLNDFSEVFEGKSSAERSAVTEQMKDRFGQNFIVLPNPYYGDWENAVFGYQRGLAAEEKNRLRIEALKAY